MLILEFTYDLDEIFTLIDFKGSLKSLTKRLKLTHNLNRHSRRFNINTLYENNNAGLMTQIVQIASRFLLFFQGLFNENSFISN